MDKFFCIITGIVLGWVLIILILLFSGAKVIITNRDKPQPISACTVKLVDKNHNVSYLTGDSIE